MIGCHWIAILDILGFRQMVKTRKLYWLVQKMEQLFAAAERRKAFRDSRLADGRVRRRSLTLGHLHFSDTIMLWTPPMDPDDGDFNVHAFFQLCNTVADLIALALINGLPLRGGLAVGECYLDAAKQVVVGQAIVNAHLLEQEQEWLGAAVASEQLGELATFEYLEEWSGLIPYRVPTKTASSRKLFAVDWTRIPRMPKIVTQKFWKMDARVAAERALAKGLAGATQEDVSRKWQNAAEFLRVQLQRHPRRSPSLYWDVASAPADQSQRRVMPSGMSMSSAIRDTRARLKR